MPLQKEIVKKPVSLLQRLGITDTPDPDFDRRMELAQNKMRQEMPNEMARTTIKPTGILGNITNKLVSKIIGGAPVATTGPFGGISYDKSLLSKMNQNELEDTLAHELTHVGQFAKQPGIMNVLKGLIPQKDEGLPAATKSFYSSRGYDPSYRGKLDEMEAYQVENDRRNKRGDILRPGEDIQLFPPRKKEGIIWSKK